MKNATMMAPKSRRGLLIGAGYFSDFHLDSWRRMEHAEIVAVCDLDLEKANAAARKFNIDSVYQHVDEALQHGSSKHGGSKHSGLDFVDIATGPSGRQSIVEKVAASGLPMICQKPLADDLPSAEPILRIGESMDAVFMVHDNFRFQPWYREIKRLIHDDVIGDRLHSIMMRTRMGDGWGEDAYLARQPYFQTMPRLLIHETGVHFTDTFRYLGGEVTQCHARIDRLNDVIAGEDSCLMSLQFAGGGTATWDANRYNESAHENPRYTFGQMWIEGNAGSLTLSLDGEITIHPLGRSPRRHDYQPSKIGFAGDCVHACQQHFIDALDGTVECETSAAEYRKSLEIVEAAYQSAANNRPVKIGDAGDENPRGNENADRGRAATRRIVDLSLEVNGEMPGVAIESCKTIEKEGWNATTLTMYSHSGTHMDAPRHFLPTGATLDQQDLSACCGPARIVRLENITPAHQITVDDVVAAIGDVSAGDRLLFHTDWHRQYGTPAYRDRLPRISIGLANWLVEQKVSLIGVEPPSVADVNNRRELTDVHQTLFRGGVVIVEGLANLDKIDADRCEFIALPLKIQGGDGCPVRAIAIVEAGQ